MDNLLVIEDKENPQMGLSFFLLLVMEMKAGRVFSEGAEGKIEFAPTCKYTHNSNFYA